MAAPRHSNVEKLLKKIEESQIGYNSTLQGPFGTKTGLVKVTCVHGSIYACMIGHNCFHPSSSPYHTQLCIQIILHLESKYVHSQYYMPRILYYMHIGNLVRSVFVVQIP